MAEELERRGWSYIDGGMGKRMVYDSFSKRGIQVTIQYYHTGQIFAQFGEITPKKTGKLRFDLKTLKPTIKDKEYENKVREFIETDRSAREIIEVYQALKKK